MQSSKTTSWPPSSYTNRSNASETSARTPALSSSRCKQVVSFLSWRARARERGTQPSAIANHRRSKPFRKGEHEIAHAFSFDAQALGPVELLLQPQFFAGQVAKN